MESVMPIDQKMLPAKSFFLLILVSLGTASTTVKSVAGNAPTVTPTIRGNATVVTTIIKGTTNAAVKTDAQPKPTASGIVNTNTKNSIDTIVNNKVNATNSNTSGPINGNNNKTVQLSNNTFVPFVPYVAAATLKNCHLLPKDQSIVLRIKESLNEGTKMIKFHLNITHQDREFHGKNESRLYRPYFWVRSTGRHGTGLLLLRPEYDVLSLTTLEFGVVTMDVALKEEPPFCLRQLAYSDVEVLIRELVMNDFQNTTSGDIVKLSPTDSVCNMHIVNVSGVAEFRYYCCQRDETLRITCDYLKSDTWIEVLFGVIAFLKIIIILFSPILIPDGLYRVSKTAVSYAYNFAPGKTMTFRAVLTKNPGKFTKVKNKFKLSKFCHMDKFKTTLRNMLPDVPYDLTINQAEIRAKQGRLLPEDKAPVGLFETMIESFVKCKIRERASLTECCNSNFFTVITIRNRFVSWHRVLKEGMKFVVLIVLVIPWLLRVAIYYGFEHDEMHMRKDAANEKSLKFYFPGSVTLYLTPLHALFILIYLVLTFESCVFGIIGKRTRERFKIVLRKCFRDMREINRIDVFGWLIRIAVKPCTKFGCIGICIGLVSWVFMMPFLFIILSFYIFPTVNVTFRLLAHFVLFLFPRNFCSKYTWLRKLSEAMENVEKTLEMERITKEECLEKRDSIMSSNLQRLLQLVIIILCLISMYSIIFLITEFISFIVEVFVYTLMGIILNASVSMTYISLAFLLGVYGNDCFGYVNKTFLSFNKTMNGVILGLGQTQVEKEVYSTTGKNVAFGVQPEGLQMVEEPVKVTSNVDGLPRWRMSRIVLFLSDKDQPMLPRGFYFRSCRMPYYAAPGELLLSYTKAFAEFSTIVIFLLFVLVVVMAFGDIYVLSPTNRMLATIAGGFLPFMLRNFVFQSHAVPSVDTSSLPFKVCLYDLLRDYEQTWPIYDIDVIKRQTLGKYVERLASIEELNETNTDVFENDIDKSAVSETIGLINDTLKPVDNDYIDMLIVVPEIINQEEFPGMFDNETSYREFSGSTSFLDDDTEWPADA